MYLGGAWLPNPARRPSTDHALPDEPEPALPPQPPPRREIPAAADARESPDAQFQKPGKLTAGSEIKSPLPEDKNEPLASSSYPLGKAQATPLADLKDASGKVLQVLDIAWAKDGQYAYFILDRGVIRKVRFPDLVEVKRLSLPVTAGSQRKRPRAASPNLGRARFPPKGR